ncbi:MAG: YdcF family protein [Cyanobacteria bacterium J06642_2]
MLDPTLCDRPVSDWIELKLWLRQLLMTPIHTIPSLILVAAVPWLVPRITLQWRRLLGVLAAFPLILYIFLPLPAPLYAAEAGLTALLPADTGESVDAIVVLGRGPLFRYSRTVLARKLWNDGRAPRIFASGRGDARIIMRRLTRRGIPDAALAGEACSQTTEENARFTAALLQPEGVKSILLVTDGPHMLRSLLTFRSLGFHTIPHLSPIPERAPRREALMVVQEYLGLVVYAVKGRYWPRRAPELDNAIGAVPPLLARQSRSTLAGS